MQIPLSDSIAAIEESGIRKIFQLAAKNDQQYINLSIGQPHFKTPKDLKRAAQKAIEDDHNAYFPTLGSMALRKKVAQKLNEVNQIDANIDEVMITTGVAGGIFLALSALINPGDEVILPDPYFVLYKQLLDYLGAKIVYLDTYPHFDLDPDKLKPLITDKTKLLIINSPNNPTGKVYSETTLLKVKDIVAQHDLLVLSDEIYEVFDYENNFFSIGSIYPKTITLNGFSKSHAITGWRIGYLHAPLAIIEAVNKLQQYSFVCAPSFAQIALASEFNSDISNFVEYYKKNRDFLLRELSGLYEIELPTGAFYAFVKIPDNKPDFIPKLIENKLLVVPGEVFSKKEGYFRLSFATTLTTLKSGISILKQLV